MPPVIRVQNLSKSYRITHGQPRHRYGTLRDSLAAAATWPIRKLQGKAGGSVEEFWALKDLSLEVQQGEVVGIIGRNGAGKSTLLKLLSRITAPTTGRIELHGRVGSLLEVGTGFHPELTGRENVFLNGSILGMTRREIQKKFDEIVEFSGVEKFLDTPVKRYSSGMYVRLAFAVAAHLEPEILIVDEVLAVGDLSFQRKCLGRMEEVSQGGRTILFVSHNMAAIQNLCRRCVVLDGGQMAFDGSVGDGIDRYLQNIADTAAADIGSRTDRKGAGHVRFTAIELRDGDERVVSSIPMGAPLRICLSYRSESPVPHAIAAIAFHTSVGQRLFRLHTRDQAVEFPDLCSSGTLICEVPSLPLLPGTYRLHVAIADATDTLQDAIDSAVFLDIVPADVFGTGRIPQGPGDILFVPSKWSHR